MQLQRREIGAEALADGVRPGLPIRKIGKGDEERTSTM
jgi:hypothetical protein